MEDMSMKSAKTTVLIPVLAVLLCGCATMNHPDDKWFGRDKAYHFGISAGISAGLAAVAENNGCNDGEAMAFAVAFTMPIGAGKELYDRNVKKTYCSGKDLAWDLAGALVGGASSVLLRH